jgi:hypothetical protein
MTEPTMETITLRTGETVPEPVLKTVCIALRELEFLDLYEAVQLARHPGHHLWEPSGRKLRSLGLLDSSGKLHELTAKVVRAATTGDDLEVRLVSPIR